MYCNNISEYYCFVVFDQINATLVSIRNSKSFKQSYRHEMFFHCLLCDRCYLRCCDNKASLKHCICIFFNRVVCSKFVQNWDTAITKKQLTAKNIHCQSLTQMCNVTMTTNVGMLAKETTIWTGKKIRSCHILNSQCNFAESNFLRPGKCIYD